jgi:uncharacterized Ntn-hydrolase superfamily protein
VAGCGRRVQRGEGSFSRRLLAALDAAQTAGGDARGQMSAAIVVVADRPAAAGNGRVVDVRVDHSNNPLTELARLLDATDAYHHFTAGVDALFAGDAGEALAHADHGLMFLPDDRNLHFLRAAALLGCGDVDGAQDAVGQLIERHSSWATVVCGFVARGLITIPEQLTDNLLG